MYTYDDLLHAKVWYLIPRLLWWKNLPVLLMKIRNKNRNRNKMNLSFHSFIVAGAHSIYFIFNEENAPFLRSRLSTVS